MADASVAGNAQKISQRVNTSSKKSDINAEARQAPMRRISAGGGALITLIAVILLLAAAGVAVFFNVANSRMAIVGLLQSADPIVGQEFDAFRAERAALQVAQSELEAESARLETERARLNTQTSQLAKRESALMDAEEDQAIYEENMAKAAQDREKMISLISQLDAPAAARILTGLEDPKEIVDILLVLKEKFAASILKAMDSVVATRVAKEALNRNADTTFLQGLPYDLLPDYEIPTPAATVEPTPEPTPVPTPNKATKVAMHVPASSSPTSAFLPLTYREGSSE